MRLFLFLLLFLTACQQNENAQSIIGKWQGIAFTEEKDSMEIDPSEIQFDFRPNGKYQFISTLNYKEAGQYAIEKSILYTTDTTHLDTERKAVRLDFLSPDTLLLEMDRDGKFQELQLVRMEN